MLSALRLAEKDERIFTILVGALAIGMILGLVSFAIGSAWYFIRHYFTPRCTLNTYTFKLFRRRPNYKHPATVMISAFNVQMESADPFRTRLELAHAYPGWAIASDFTSATDEDFDEVFGDENFDVFGDAA